MSEKLQTINGRLFMNHLLSQIWMGDWEGYETAISDIPKPLLASFPFHSNYNREEVSLWYDNYFVIPGDHFVSPYLSAHTKDQSEDLENIKKELLCLIGIYDKVGYYYPLEKNMYPDHIGSLASFLVAAINEEVKAYDKNDVKLGLEIRELEVEVIEKYMFPLLVAIQKQAQDHILLPYFRNFIQYYIDMLKMDWEEVHRAS